MFLNKIRNIFCVPDTKFVSATNVVRAGKRGNICVGNNVSSFARALSTIISFSEATTSDTVKKHLVNVLNREVTTWRLLNFKMCF